MKILNGGHNLTHQVTYNLGLDIVRGKYKFGGEFPTEAQLADQYDISRSVMREAVKMLTAKGLISSRPRQGIRLQATSEWNMFDSDVLMWTLNSRPSLELLKEFTQLRVAIEPEAAALAAQGASEEQKADILAALERMRQAELGNDDALESDIEFHTTILLASGNRFFIQLRDFIETALRVSITHTNRIKNVHFASFADHKRVCDPIISGNSDSARTAIKALLNEAIDLIDSSLLTRR
ncbi:FadR/GntR family transcriptional regulator [Teredinibacter turnerae]|uniref:FadR/GntR family transcriptional regulator n=1 Tax=Teredinibacter turnerae TaxID=2426 RepID=UPI000370B95D|nr:FadR/GntR family transcriptional regulator [Teredinibacter turnerae]